jgi:hypothetical protein
MLIAEWFDRVLLSGLQPYYSILLLPLILQCGGTTNLTSVKTTKKPVSVALPIVASSLMTVLTKVGVALSRRCRKERIGGGGRPWPTSIPSGLR